MPAPILPSIQTDRRPGHFPPAEDGVRYLKLPLIAL